MKVDRDKIEDALERDWRAFSLSTEEHVTIPSHFREGWLYAHARLIPWLRGRGPFNADE
jgi:hypothetical protein